MKRYVQSLLLAASMQLAGQALAVDKAKSSAPSAEEKAMMEKMMQAGTPGDAHKKLEPLAGKFTVKTKTWNDPSKPPEEGTGTSERKWIMGNRYLQEQYNGAYGGQPFTGTGFTGYDNVTKKYFGTWIDSMSTSMAVLRGSMNGNAIQFKGLMSDPMAGKEVDYTMTITMTGKDSHLLEMWGPGPGGKSVKWMELAYTRAK